MSEPFVTIFTPAYNVENYITVCIEGVLNQTYGNFEWILVDNGSMDNTRKIIREYAQKDDRIKLVRFKRNTDGFAQDMLVNFARGTYIVKLDSDDFWDSRYLEKLINAMETNGADLVCCRAVVLDEVNNEQYYHGFRKYEGLVTPENLAEQYSEIEMEMNTYWAKLMKRDLFIKAYNTYDRYREKIRVGFCGDTVFMYSYLIECQKSVFLMDALYVYRVHRKNASKSVTDINVLEDCLASFEVKKNLLQKCDAWNEQNVSLVYNAFWGNLDTVFTNIVKDDALDNRKKMELIEKVLSDERVMEIRREYWDEQIRKKISTHIAWCYMNMEKECENAFWKMLIVFEPELFSEITEEQFHFLMTEKMLLGLLILGEREEALQYLEKLHAECDSEEYGIYSYFCDRLIGTV